MLSKFFSKNIDEGIALGKKGLSINPNDTEILGEFGSRLSQAGHYDEGRALISRALLHDPANANFYYAQLALIDYARADYASADAMAVRSLKLESSMYGFVAALIKAETGDIAAARRLYSQFVAVRPDFPAVMDVEMETRNFPPDLQARMRATVAKIQGT